MKTVHAAQTVLRSTYSSRHSKAKFLQKVYVARKHARTFFLERSLLYCNKKHEKDKNAGKINFMMDN
jgi:hypothetical protein